MDHGHTGTASSSEASIKRRVCIRHPKGYDWSKEPSESVILAASSYLWNYGFTGFGPVHQDDVYVHIFIPSHVDGLSLSDNEAPRELFDNALHIKTLRARINEGGYPLVPAQNLTMFTNLESLSLNLVVPQGGTAYERLELMADVADNLKNLTGLRSLSVHCQEENDYEIFTDMADSVAMAALHLPHLQDLRLTHGYSQQDGGWEHMAQHGHAVGQHLTRLDVLNTAQEDGDRICSILYHMRKLEHLVISGRYSSPSITPSGLADISLAGLSKLRTLEASIALDDPVLDMVAVTLALVKLSNLECLELRFHCEFAIHLPSVEKAAKALSAALSRTYCTFKYRALPSSATYGSPPSLPAPTIKTAPSLDDWVMICPELPTSHEDNSPPTSPINYPESGPYSPISCPIEGPECGATYSPRGTPTCTPLSHLPTAGTPTYGCACPSTADCSEERSLEIPIIVASKDGDLNEDDHTPCSARAGSPPCTPVDDTVLVDGHRCAVEPHPPLNVASMGRCKRSMPDREAACESKRARVEDIAQDDSPDESAYNYCWEFDPQDYFEDVYGLEDMD